jgi:hypothetical protein
MICDHIPVNLFISNVLFLYRFSIANTYLPFNFSATDLEFCIADIRVLSKICIIDMSVPFNSCIIGVHFPFSFYITEIPTAFYFFLISIPVPFFINQQGVTFQYYALHFTAATANSS